MQWLFLVQIVGRFAAKILPAFEVSLLRHMQEKALLHEPPIRPAVLCAQSQNHNLLMAPIMVPTIAKDTVSDDSQFLITP